MDFEPPGDIVSIPTFKMIEFRDLYIFLFFARFVYAVTQNHEIKKLEICDGNTFLVEIVSIEIW